MSAAGYRVQLSPDLAVRVDGSQCIVLDVTDPGTGKLLRTAVVTDVGAFKAALDGARAAQGEIEREGRLQRRLGIDEAEAARGRLSRIAAVNLLADELKIERSRAANITSRAVSAGPQPAESEFGRATVTFLGGTKFAVEFAGESAGSSAEEACPDCGAAVREKTLAEGGGVVCAAGCGWWFCY